MQTVTVEFSVSTDILGSEIKEIVTLDENDIDFDNFDNELDDVFNEWLLNNIETYCNVINRSE